MPEHNNAPQSWTPVEDGDPPLFTGPHTQLGFGRPDVVPGISHVFVTADGDYSTSERRPSIGQAFSARRRYDVDVTYKTAELSHLDLPSAQNNFYFPCSISLAWRVHDPVSIVRNGIANPTVVIEQSVVRTLREVAAGIDPEDWAVAESRLNHAFADQFALPEGITVLRFVAKLTIDPHLAQHLADRANAQGVLRIEEMNRSVVEAALLRGDIGLMVQHLVKNPGATADVINLVVSSRNADEGKRQEMFKLLLENKVIQDVDLERFRESLLTLQGGIGRSSLSLLGSNAVGKLAPARAGHEPPAIPAQSENHGAADASGVVEWEAVEPVADHGDDVREER